jgi:hypothetical protein
MLDKLVLERSEVSALYTVALLQRNTRSLPRLPHLHRFITAR